MVAIGGIIKFSTVDYPGHAVASVFTIGCNMRCGYCHNPELVLPEQYADTIPEDEILQFLETRKGLLDGVAISGGEPTMQEDLPQFIGRIKVMGFQVKLDTNGTNPSMLRRLVKHSLVDFIAMDIKGPLDKYQQIAARPVNIDDIQESIRIIQTVPHEFRTTIVRGQLEVDDFHSIGKLIRGADRFALQAVTQGRSVSHQFTNAVSFNTDEMRQVQQIMERYVGVCVVH